MKYFINSTVALIKVGFIGALRSPSFIIFSIGFPFVFIIAFGFIGGQEDPLNIALNKNVEEHNVFVQKLEKITSINLQDVNLRSEEKLINGNLDAIISIKNRKNDNQTTYELALSFSDISPQKQEMIEIMVENILLKLNQKGLNNLDEKYHLKTYVQKGEKISRVDFILPGQLGFSLMSSGVFGTAFVFVLSRKLLIIKKFFSTPVSKLSILIGEIFSRLLFSLLSAAIIIAMGYYMFNFTLINGLSSVINMLFLCTVGLILFLAVGLLISSIVNEEKNIPPIANIFTLPQFLISGTFFPISVYPLWLQKIAYVLPLTYLNDGLRKIALEGASLWDIRLDFLVLIIWIAVITFLTTKFFKWT